MGSLENRKKVWIIGANSDIAQKLILQLAQLKYDLILTSRNLTNLNTFVNENHISATVYSLAITNQDSLITFYQQYLSEKLDGVIYCAGFLPDEIAPLQGIEVKDVFVSNVTAFITLLEGVKEHFKTCGKGFIIALSSIAGERGKSSNKIYGATKAALTVYLQGLMQE